MGKKTNPSDYEQFCTIRCSYRALFPSSSEAKNNYTAYVEYVPTFLGLFRSLNVTAFPLSGFVSGLIVLCSLISTWVHSGIGCWNMIVSTIGGCRFLMPHTALMSFTPSVRLSWQWKTGSILAHIFPLWGERGSRREPWLNSDTIKMETESCLALGAAWDQTWVTPVGCLAAEIPRLDWRWTRNVHVKTHMYVVSRDLSQQRQGEVCLSIFTKSGSSPISSPLVSKEPCN